MKKMFRFVIALIVAHLAGAALAQQTSVFSADPDAKLNLQFSPYTFHYTPDPNHKAVWMVGLEREHRNGDVDGATFFSNSFGQPCAYIYPWGATYQSILGVKPLSFKWTAGLIYGYVEPYENKVPLNFNGLSAGAIAALEYKFDGWSAQIDLLGTAAMMFQINVPLK